MAIFKIQQLSLRIFTSKKLINRLRKNRQVTERSLVLKINIGSTQVNQIVSDFVNNKVRIR